MNIYAQRGTKVRFLAENGYDHQKEKCRELGLKKGDILTVKFDVVGSWSNCVSRMGQIFDW